MRLVGYARVSRVGGRNGDSFISPTVQRQQMSAYAKAHGHKIGTVYEDLDESGGKASRPEFDKALAAIEEGTADGLIVAKLDRFMRSLPDALDVIERIESAGGQLISVSDNFDSSTPMGRFARDLVLRLGQLERERIAEAWQTALANANARGIHVASRCPTGYRRREDKRLEPDPVAAPVIHELFVRRGDGVSWSELARFLNESGVVGPYGSPNWSHTAVSKIIRNRVYLGEARSNHHINPDAHEPLVTQEEWDRAQSRNGHQGTAPRANDTLLSGLLRCAGCRYLMKVDKHRSEGGERLRSYRCRGDHAAGKCPHKAFSLARAVEPFVEREFLAALGPDGPLAESAASTAELEAAQAEVEAAAAELDAYVTAASALDAALFQRGLQVRQKKLDDARMTAAELRARQPAGAGMTVALRDVWGELSVPEKRDLLAAAIDGVMLRQARTQGEPIGQRVKILWRGEAPADLPRRGVRPPLASFDW